MTAYNKLSVGDIFCHLEKAFDFLNKMARVVIEPWEWLRKTWLGNKMARVVNEKWECLRKTW